MDTTEFEPATRSTPERPRQLLPQRRVRIAIALLAPVLAFLIGFGVKWNDARAATAMSRALEAQIDSVQGELALERAASTLAGAFMKATYGDFEGARDGARAFFESVDGLKSLIEPEAAPELEQLSARRDDVMSLLMARDDVGVHQLAGVYEQYVMVAFGRELALRIPRGLADEPGVP
jgi:hypothetical protein